MSDLISGEEWKVIDGFPNYKVSNLGRVMNLKGNILKPFKKSKYGYALVGLSQDGKTQKFQVHRLVAIAFIENLDNKPEVCHKDNVLDKNGFLNNSASNLVWGTHKENCEFTNTRKRQSENHANFNGRNNPNYGNHYSQKNKERLMKERGKQVLQWKDGRVIAFYESLKDAGRKTGICWVSIRNVCNGEYKHAGGYEWSCVCKTYDVDKVVEQLKAKSFERYNNDGMGGELVVNFDDAIEIVKGGGKDE